MLSKFEKRAFLALGMSAAPLFILHLIYIYGVPVPYGDQWELIPLLDKLFNHNLQLSDFWVQHNEHRIVFPKILMLTMAYFTGWDIRYELYMNAIIAGITLLLLCTLLKKTFAGQSPMWLPIAFSFIVFSPSQWENWSWGWELTIFMTILGTVAAVLSLTVWPGKWKGLIIAIAAAVFASFSFANGILTWAVAGLILLMQKERKWRHIALWAIMSAATICLYFYKYTKPSEHPSLLVCLYYPWYFILYVLAYIGSPLAFARISIAVITGAVLVIMMCAMVIHIRRLDRKSFIPILPWVALAAYALLSGCVTGVARLGFRQIIQAMSSRYSTIAELFIISVLAVLAHWVRLYTETHKNFPRGLVILKYLFFSLLVSGYVMSSNYGIYRMQEQANTLRTGWIGLQRYEKVSDEYLQLLYYPMSANFPNRADIVRERARILSRLGIILPKSEVGNQTSEQSTFPRGD